MIDTSRGREKMEGWKGRRRTYQCLECKGNFQVDTLNPIPEKDRLCFTCKRNTSYIFIDKHTGKEYEVRASSPELATLRAWDINSNLTIKIPQERSKDNEQSIPTTTKETGLHPTP